MNAMHEPQYDPTPIWKKPGFILFLLYAVSHSLMVFNASGLYWDDYYFFGGEAARFRDIYRQAGATQIYPIMAMVHRIGDLQSSAHLARAISFLCYGFVAFAVWRVLGHLRFLGREQSFGIALLAALLPIQNVRDPMIMLPYALCWATFWAAVCLLPYLVQAQRPSLLHWLARLGAVLLFFASFTVNSLLFFYGFAALFAGYLLYDSGQAEPTVTENRSVLQTLRVLILRFPDFVAVPIVFLWVKLRFLKPYGIYADYNQVQVQYDLEFWNSVLQTVEQNLIRPLGKPFLAAVEYWPLTLGVLILLDRLFGGAKAWTALGKGFGSVQKRVLALGVGLMLAAIFPYALVGKFGRMFGWESRHQLLAALGSAFVIWSLCAILAQVRQWKAWVPRVYTLILSVCVVQNIAIHVDYFEDGMYQDALRAHFAQDRLFERHRTFHAQVQGREKLLFKREIRAYEFNGMLTELFGTSLRYMAEGSSAQAVYREANGYAKRPGSNAADWFHDGAIVPVRIELHDLEFLDFVRSVFRPIWPAAYAQSLSRIVTVSAGP